MARVPTYDGQQVQSTALQTPTQGPIDASSGLRAVGQALGQVAGEIDKFQTRAAQDEAWRTNATVNEEFIKFQEGERANAKGANANGHAQRVTEWWDKARETYGKDLNPLAKELVGKQIGQSRLQALTQASTYQNSELERSRVESLDASLQSEQKKGIAAGNGAGSVANMAEQLRAYAASQGKSSEWVDQQLQRYATPMHEAVIARIQKSSAEDAKRYFETNKDAISATRWESIEKGFETAGRLKTAQTFADGAMAKGVTLDVALAAAREKFDGDDESTVVAEIKTRFAENEAVTNLATKKLAKSAWADLMTVGSTGRMDPKLLTELRQQAPEEYRQMMDWQDAKRRQAKAEREGVVDPDEQGRYYTFVRMALDNPSAFASLDLAKVSPQVSKAQWSSLVSMQTGISKGDAKAMQQQTQIKATLNAVKGSILSAGIDLTPKEGTGKAKEFENFMGSLTTALTDAQAAQPDKPLTQDQLKLIGMSMLKVGYEQGSGLFGFGVNKVRGFEQEPGKSYVETRFGDIPPTVRAALEKDYDAANRGAGIYGNASERAAAIELAYQRGREQGRFK